MAFVTAVADMKGWFVGVQTDKVYQQGDDVSMVTSRVAI